LSVDVGYGQFCPISMAAEVLCTRWTPVLIRELLAGSTRFNELRRGVPRMSPTLLSTRLKELEAAGIVSVSFGPGGQNTYHLTEAGRDLKDVVMAMGSWGQKWIESKLSLRKLDPTLLMWDMRRGVDLQELPSRRCTIQFLYPELSKEKQSYWLIVEKGEADLCWVDPGFEVDLLVEGSLRAMTSVWMGFSTMAQEADQGALSVEGDPQLARSMQKWLGLSPFASTKRRVA
jgi:DNA-binding HxlR family transcriptional regulator